MQYRKEQHGLNEEFLGLGLTSRKNLCVHPSVSWYLLFCLEKLTRDHIGRSREKRKARSLMLDVGI